MVSHFFKAWGIPQKVEITTRLTTESPTASLPAHRQTATALPAATELHSAAGPVSYAMPSYGVTPALSSLRGAIGYFEHGLLGQGAPRQQDNAAEAAEERRGLLQQEVWHTRTTKQ